MTGSRLVFPPIESSTATEKYVVELRANEGDGMPLYIPKMEYDPRTQKGFLPVKRGEIIMVIGRPGNGKSGFMFRWARQRANDLRRRGKDDVVLYWTMEQLVEELRLFHVAAESGISASDMASGKVEDAQWDIVNKTLRGLHTSPLWLAGKSMARRKDKLKLTEQTLREALESIEVWQGDNLKTSIDCVFIDYLQRFRSDKQDWVQFYGDLVNGLKDMTADFATRFVVGVQAKREVDARAVQIPHMEDGQWTSGIEQQADGILTLVRPSHYTDEGAMWDEDGDNVLVQGHQQMIVYCAKRKLGPENFKSWVNFAPEYNRLDEAELRNFNPNADNDEYRGEGR